MLHLKHAAEVKVLKGPAKHTPLEHKRYQEVLKKLRLCHLWEKSTFIATNGCNVFAEWADPVTRTKSRNNSQRKESRTCFNETSGLLQ